MKFSLSAFLTLVVTANAFVVTPPSLSSTKKHSVSMKPTTSVVVDMSKNPEQSVFLTPSMAKECIDVAGGTPLYAYSLEKLEESANNCLGFPNAFGLTVRYAAKACPNSSILKFFSNKGIHMDCSSGYEVRRAMAAGIPADHISLSSQELPYDFADLMDMGVKVNAW
jgi:diaminopimelate decarboxylase